MRTNPWPMKAGLSLFAVVVVSVVLFEHVRGVEPDGRPERIAAVTPDKIIPGAGSAGAEKDSTAGGNAAVDGAADGSVRRGNVESGAAEAAIRRTADAFTAAFDRGDAAAIAALWTADGEYLDGAGKRFVGRDAIERQYARFFAEQPGAKIKITIDAIRPIGADAAIEDGHATLLPRQPGAPPSSPYTVIHTKVDGRWLMASVREPLVEQPAADDPLRSLDWLVGSWQAEQNGGRMNVTFRWVAGHRFLERIYSVEQRGRITSSGVHLIGQDPGSQELQSWSFTSDAGFAVGNWIARPDGWAIVTRGKLPDGTTTGAVNYLTRLDENTLSWQSRERKAGKNSLPDTDAVRLTRVASQR